MSIINTTDTAYLSIPTAPTFQRHHYQLKIGIYNRIFQALVRTKLFP